MAHGTAPDWVAGMLRLAHREEALEAAEVLVWRYRLGQFRLFYGIDVSNRTVYIVTIDYRKDAYI